MTGERPPTHDRRRRGLPDRLLLPPAPREPALAARWRSLPFERRRALAHASLRGTAPLPTEDAHDGRAEGETADAGDAAAEDAELVRGLARARVATGWRLQVAAVVLGWLVLMTIWGFGRSTFPERQDAWLLGGLAVGALAWLSAAAAARRRVRRARHVASGPTAGTGG